MYVCMGSSKNGKSTFINKVTGSELGVAKYSEQSCTKEISVANDYMDTQGINDTAATKDLREIFIDILSTCVKAGEIAGFLVFTSISSTDYAETCVGGLKALFGVDITNKIAIVFTMVGDAKGNMRFKENLNSLKSKYSGILQLPWDSEECTSEMLEELENIRKELKSKSSTIISNFFKALEDSAREMRENARRIHRFMDSGYWEWNETSSGPLIGSIFSFGISSIVKEDSYDTKIISTGIPYDASISSKSLNMYVSSSDCWDEDHNISLTSANNVELWSKLRYAKQRHGRAYVKYKYDIEIIANGEYQYDINYCKAILVRDKIDEFFPPQKSNFQ